MRRMPHALAVIAALLVFAAALQSTAFSADSKKAKFSKEDQKKYDLAFESALARFEKFKIYLEDNKDKEAMKELNAIIDLEFPEGSDGTDGILLQVEAHIFLGEMLTEKGEFDDAVKTLKAGIKKAPDVDSRTYDLYMALGHAYKKLKKTDEALAAFKEAERINKILSDKEKKDK